MSPRSGSHILQTEAEMEWFAEQVALAIETGHSIILIGLQGCL